MRALCSVDGCKKHTHGKGLCTMHYHRVWSGRELLAPVGTGRGEAFAFLNAAAHHQGDGCLLWPYNVSSNGGYGWIKIKGKYRVAHRLVCQMAHGPAPKEKREAAHKCGVPLCVSPAHVRWATHQENMLDKIQHGTSLRGERHPFSRLTEADVIAIRSRPDLTAPALANEIGKGITAGMIQKVRTRRNWAWLPDATPPYQPYVVPRP